MTTALGTALAGLRDARGLSYRELGRRTGLSASYLCDIEKGRKGLSAEAAIALGRVLGIDARTLLILWVEAALARAVAKVSQ